MAGLLTCSRTKSLPGLTYPSEEGLKPVAKVLFSTFPHIVLFVEKHVRFGLTAAGLFRIFT
jgi:hypothetical protein